MNKGNKSKVKLFIITDSVDIKGLSTTRPSDLFSSTAGLSGRTTDSWLEGDDLPFAIHPEMGTIPPGKSEECTLKFSPKDVFYYKAYLTCKYGFDESVYIYIYIYIWKEIIFYL